MSKIITVSLPQMDPFEIPDNHLHHGGYSVSNNSISKELKELLIHPYYYCFPGEVACLMISDCLQKDPTIAFEDLDLTGRKLLNYVAMWCNDTDGCVALIRKIKEMGGDINCGAPLNKHSPLKLATKHVHIKKIKVLLELGANVIDYDDLINTLDHSSVTNSIGDRVFAVNKDREEKYKNAKKELKSTELSHEWLLQDLVTLENKIVDAQEKIAKQKIKISELEEKIMGEKESFGEYKKLAQGAFVNKKSAIMELLEEHKNKKSEDEIKKIGGRDINV